MTTDFENVDKIIWIETMIHSQIHQKQSKIHRSQRIQRNDDSESHTILNSMLLSTRKPRPIEEKRQM